MLSHIIYSLSLKLIYIVYLGQKGGGGGPPGPPLNPPLIYIFRGEDTQSEWMKRDESKRVYWFQTRFLSLVYL